MTAVIVSGLGAALNAVAAVLANDDTADDAQLGLTIGGVGGIGLGSMFFAIREGIASDDLQRAERASADALMGAATGMMEHSENGGPEFERAADECAEALDLVHGAYATTDPSEDFSRLRAALVAVEEVRQLGARAAARQGLDEADAGVAPVEGEGESAAPDAGPVDATP